MKQNPVFLKLYYNYLDDLSSFTDAQVGRLVRGMLRYAVSGEQPQFRGSEKHIWGFLQSQIDRDIAHYEYVSTVRQASGSKGGRPRKQMVSEKTKCFSEKAKKPMIKNKDKDYDQENDQEKEKDYENEYDQDEDFNPLSPCGEKRLVLRGGKMESS